MIIVNCANIITLCCLLCMYYGSFSGIDVGLCVYCYCGNNANNAEHAKVYYSIDCMYCAIKYTIICNEYVPLNAQVAFGTSIV